MSTRVEKSVMVNVPVSRAYNQWTQFEDFPQFMGSVQSVTQLGDDRLQWVAQIAGVRREWEAKILEQVPDRKVAWAATEGATNAGAVSFEDLGGDQTSVTLVLEYEPKGLVEKAGDKLNIVENQAESDLDRFKAFIESEGYATGAWRGSVESAGSVGTPGVENAAETKDDSGKAGLSGKAVAAGLGVAAAAVAVAANAKKGDSTDADTMPDMDVSTPVSAPVVTEQQSVTPVGSDAGWTAPESGTGTDTFTEPGRDTGRDRAGETGTGTGMGTPMGGAGMGAGMGAGAGMGTGAGLGAGLGAGADDDEDTGAGSGTVAGTDSNTESGTEWGSEPASESGTETPIGAPGAGHMLSNKEIEDGASDVPLGESGSQGSRDS